MRCGGDFDLAFEYPMFRAIQLVVAHAKQCEDVVNVMRCRSMIAYKNTICTGEGRCRD